MPPHRATIVGDLVVKGVGAKDVPGVDRRCDIDGIATLYKWNGANRHSSEPPPQSLITIVWIRMRRHTRVAGAAVVGWAGGGGGRLDGGWSGPG